MEQGALAREIRRRQRELSRLIEKGLPLIDREVCRQSQELDQLVVQYMRQKKADEVCVKG